MPINKENKFKHYTENRVSSLGLFNNNSNQPLPPERDDCAARKFCCLSFITALGCCLGLPPAGIFLGALPATAAVLSTPAALAEAGCRIS